MVVAHAAVQVEAAFEGWGHYLDCCCCWQERKPARATASIASHQQGSNSGLTNWLCVNPHCGQQASKQGRCLSVQGEVRALPFSMAPPALQQPAQPPTTNPVQGGGTGQQK